MSVIESYVADLDPLDCSLRLLKRIKEILESNKLSFSALANIIGLQKDRAEYISSSASPELYREEVNSLCLAMGIGLDSVFLLPHFPDREAIMNEYEFLSSKESGFEIEGIARFGIASRLCNYDAMKSVLNLYCIRKCLMRYPSYKDIK